jgi:hypothetical protein
LAHFLLENAMAINQNEFALFIGTILGRRWFGIQQDKDGKSVQKLTKSEKMTSNKGVANERENACPAPIRIA